MWKWFFSWDQLCLYSFRLNREPISLVEPRGDVNLAFIRGGEDCEAYDLFDITETAFSRRRLEEGKIACVVLHEGRIASYCWVALKKAKIGEIGREIHLREGEVYLYDAMTFPAFRGKGFYPAILSHILRYVQEEGFQRALIFTLRSNQASVRGIEKCGFRLFQRITLIQFLGLSFPIYGRVREGEMGVEFLDRGNL